MTRPNVEARSERCDLLIFECRSRSVQAPDSTVVAEASDPRDTRDTGELTILVMAIAK